MVDLKPIKRAVQSSGLLLRRWVVLGVLVLAVGAVAVWGSVNQGREEPQGASGLLMEQLQAHIGADAEAGEVLQPASGNEIFNAKDTENKPGTAGNTGFNKSESDKSDLNKAAASNDGARAEQPETLPGGGAASSGDNKQDNKENPQDKAAAGDEEDVYDYAPEPWLADTALSAEAKLLKMLEPVSGGVCSRDFGYSYDPTFRDYRFHRGLDIEAPAGTTVSCPLGAEVGDIEDDGFGGQVIVLEHGDKLVSRLEGVRPVEGLKAGDKLAAGDKLGEIGDPPLAEDAQPAHLHWELLLDGEPVDAAAYGYGG